MYTKYFFALFMCILIFNFAYSLDQDQIPTKLNETYLFSPIDNSETVSSSNEIFYLNQKYWAIETNNNLFFVISDKNAAMFVNKETLDAVLKTYFFFSKINKQNNTQIAYYFNKIPDDLFTFNYNLELVKKEIEHLEFPDENVLIGIQNIQTRSKNVVDDTIELTKELISLDTNLTKFSYENYQNIKELNKAIQTTSNDITQKINLLQRSITDLKIILVDSNLSTDLKYQLGNNVLVLPQTVLQAQEYTTQLNTNISEITFASNYADEANLDSIEKNWEIRLKRVSFLKKYLAIDKDISSKTKQKTMKELFDLIIASTNDWQNNKETTAFVNAYNKMNTDISKGDYDIAERQLTPLKDSALKIFAVGKTIATNTTNNNGTTTDSTDTEEQDSNPIYTIVLICLGAIVLIIIIINIIKKIKESKETKDKNDENKEIEVNFN